MDEKTKLREALGLLYQWTKELCKYSGEDEEAAKKLWNDLVSAPEILREYAYYYDNREFLCEYTVENLTIADVLVWQMDHFKAHMDRADSENRYNKDRLILSTFRTMLELRENPKKILAEIEGETGTDLAEGWNLH